MNKEEQDNIVKLKFSNGHQIWAFKKTVNKFKYIGVYRKPIKNEK